MVPESKVDGLACTRVGEHGDVSTLYTDEPEDRLGQVDAN